MRVLSEYHFIALDHGPACVVRTPEFLHVPVDFRCHPDENTLAAWAAEKWTEVTNLAEFLP